LAEWSPSRCSNFARLCLELAGAGGTVEAVPRSPEGQKIDIGSFYVDHARLAQLTGWEPHLLLRDGLAETFAFYREHGERY
jgi:UDP-glucose 4-epimerase